MKNVAEIKEFLQVEELTKLEQGAVQGGEAQGKQKQKQKNDAGDNDAGGPVQKLE